MIFFKGNQLAVIKISKNFTAIGCKNEKLFLNLIIDLVIPDI
jgi:hypothetical protein